MEGIKTYAIGNGEITLTEQDAEELRRLLQFEYIESCVKEIISADPDSFHFTSEHNLPQFARRIADMHDDIVDMTGGYCECLEESVYHIGKHVGVVGDYAEDFIAASDQFDMDAFWKG